MKIRSDFVTNSSSSSYLSISIKSKRLVKMLGKYEELMAGCEECCEGFNLEDDVLEMEISESAPNIVPEDIEEVVESLGNVLDFLTENVMDDCPEDEYEELTETLEEKGEALTGSIKSVEWHYSDSQHDGEFARYEKNLYSKESLNKVYAKIAEQKGCSVDEITDEDFKAYVSDKTSLEERSFTYDKASGDEGTYKADFGLKDL